MNFPEMIKKELAQNTNVLKFSYSNKHIAFSRQKIIWQIVQ